MTFGYNNLVVDFRSLPQLSALGYPVVFDATHSVQQPGGLGTAPRAASASTCRHLARAAAAVGIDALFVEVHENPDAAPSDGPNMLTLDGLDALLRDVIACASALLKLASCRPHDRASRLDPVRQRSTQKPWLLLGKGPTFSRREEFPLGDFNLMGLNDVVAEQKVDVAHIIDIDVVEQRRRRAWSENCQFLVMPRRPHVNFRAGRALARGATSTSSRCCASSTSRAASSGTTPALGAAGRRLAGRSGPLLQLRGGDEHPRRDGRQDGADARHRRRHAATATSSTGLPAAAATACRASTRSSASSRTSSPSAGIDYDPLIEPMRVFVGLRRVADRRRAGARVLDPQAREPAGALLPDARRADADAEGPEEPRAHRLLVQPLPHPASCPATRAARSTSTPTCRCSATSPSCGTSRSTARRCMCTARTSRREQWKDSSGSTPAAR